MSGLVLLQFFKNSSLVLVGEEGEVGVSTVQRERERSRGITVLDCLDDRFTFIKLLSRNRSVLSYIFPPEVRLYYCRIN